MEDFKEIFYFGVSMVITAFVITLIALFGTTARQMANIRNDELQAVENVQTARKYTAYDNKTVTGAEVIALLRENAQDGELQIYVDRNKNNTSLTMNEGNYTNTTWKLTSLMQSIDAGTVYTAILVYGYDSPATAIYTAYSNSMVTGVRFTKV